MHIKNNFLKILCILMFVPILLSSCKDDDLDVQLFEGLWVQEQVTEDGQVLTMSDKEKNLKLLIEGNGIYRTFTTDGVESIQQYGAWTTTDDKWLDLNTNIWHVKVVPTIKDNGEIKDGEWGSNQVLSRFTILSITNDRMEIRMKAYLGEVKYSPVFVAHERPQITFDNIDELVKEYKTLKTYIFTFKKSSNLQH